jgi:hypothetical protein
MEVRLSSECARPIHEDRASILQIIRGQILSHD